MRLWLTFAALNGVMAVAGGAYGWHVLASANDPAYPIFDLAVRYQMWHALALLGVAWLAWRDSASRMAAVAGALFLGGIVAFSGSLYWMALMGGVLVPYAAPIGGGLLMAGWAAVAIAGFRTPY